MHKNPVRRLVEFVSEHSRLLLIFGMKKSGSRPKFLKFDLGTCQDDAGTNCVSLSFLVPELFKSIAESFYKSGLFFSGIYLFSPIITTCRVYHAVNIPNLWGVSGLLPCL